MNLEDFPVTASLAEAAQQVLDHSFAIYRVNDELTEKIRLAHHSAAQFFRQMENEEGCGDGAAAEHTSRTEGNNQQSPLPYQRIVDGNLYGYNVPSPAKKLFRAFCQSPHQPWPEDVMFRRHSIQLAKDLHQLVVDCTMKIEKAYSSRRQRKKSFSGIVTSPPRKRSRTENDSPDDANGEEYQDTTTVVP